VEESTKERFNYETKTNHRQFVDKATEFEGEKQHGKNLYDCRAMVASIGVRGKREINKQRAKIYRYAVVEVFETDKCIIHIRRLALALFSSPIIHLKKRAREELNLFIQI
jgi:hypothetical protein